MASAPRVSVILSTYNSPDYLALVMRSYMTQSFRYFELVIADDGSTDDTQRVVESFKANTWFPITHVWQEDRGFRKARILNKAVLMSKGELLVFSDQDCIPRKEFLERHVSFSSPKVMSLGSRIWVNRLATQQALKDQITDDIFFAKESRLSILEQIHRDLLISIGMATGANFSVSRKDFLAVNGFDMDYEGFGAEDVDLGIRLHKHKCEIRKLGRQDFVFHLWHPRGDKNRRLVNKNGFQLTKRFLLKTIETQCKNGIENLQ